MFFQSLPVDVERPDFIYENGILVIGNKDIVNKAINRKVEGAKCIPTDANWTFTPIISEFKFYSSMNLDLTIYFYLDYMNTSSIRYWKEVLNILNKMKSNGCNIRIVWNYLEIDERIEEQGEDFKQFCNFEFKLKKY
jgi:hypothetical protein